MEKLAVFKKLLIHDSKRSADSVSGRLRKLLAYFCDFHIFVGDGLRRPKVALMNARHGQLASLTIVDISIP